MPACFTTFHGAGHIDSTTKKQQFLSQGGFARVGVRNDGECSPSAHFVLNRRHMGEAGGAAKAGEFNG